jgi:hypothetical protein
LRSADAYNNAANNATSPGTARYEREAMLKKRTSLGIILAVVTLAYALATVTCAQTANAP